jgi:hypothetical protein
MESFVSPNGSGSSKGTKWKPSGGRQVRRS